MSKNIKVLDKEFEPYISDERIQKKIQELAKELNKLYTGLKPIFVPVLNGSFFFASDLLKNVTIECEVSFVKLQSYSGTQSTGNVSELIGFENDIEGRHVIILEDIIDTGRTLKKIYAELMKQNPLSVFVISLLFKKEALIEDAIPDLFGFEVKNEFLLGYGLDYNQLGRNIKGIYKLR